MRIKNKTPNREITVEVSVTRSDIQKLESAVAVFDSEHKTNPTPPWVSAIRHLADGVIKASKE